MADKILMDTEGVANFRQQVSNISQMINERTRDLNYLLFNFNQISLSMNVLKQYMAQAVSEGKKIIDYLNKMASDVERARQAFIKADNDTSGVKTGSIFRAAGPTRIRGNSLIESVDKLNKYKSINININAEKAAWQDYFWDDTAPLSEYKIFGHKIPVIPSTSDLITNGLNNFGNNPIFKSDAFQSTLTGVVLSGFGTVAGNSDKIRKQILASMDKNSVITQIYGKGFYPTSNPYIKFAKVTGNLSKCLTLSSLAIDIGNTWTTDSGNTNLKRLEKSGIQAGGGLICYGVGKLSEEIASAGFITMPESGGTSFCLIAGAATIDVGASAGVTVGEDWLYNELGIK